MLVNWLAGAKDWSQVANSRLGRGLKASDIAFVSNRYSGSVQLRGYPALGAIAGDFVQGVGKLSRVLPSMYELSQTFFWHLGLESLELREVLRTYERRHRLAVSSDYNYVPFVHVAKRFCEVEFGLSRTHYPVFGLVGHLV